MLAIRKILMNRFSCITDALECMWKMVTKVAETNEIDVAFNFYIENSVEPIEYMNLLLEFPPPVKPERFCASSKNKEELQIL